MPTTMTHYLTRSIEDAILGLCHKVYFSNKLYKLYIGNTMIVANVLDDGVMTDAIVSFNVYTTKVEWHLRNTGNPCRPNGLLEWKPMVETNSVGVMVSTRATVRYTKGLIAGQRHSIQKASKVLGE